MLLPNHPELDNLFHSRNIYNNYKHVYCFTQYEKYLRKYSHCEPIHINVCQPAFVSKRHALNNLLKEFSEMLS